MGASGVLERKIPGKVSCAGSPLTNGTELIFMIVAFLKLACQTSSP
jgi:hypothetical protein